MNKTLLLALTFTAIGAACTSNPVCTEEAAGRLRKECQLSFGPTGAACLGLPGTPMDIDAAIDAHALDTCALADPGGDADCYATTSCETFLSDPLVCADDPDEPVSTERGACAAQCSQTERTCTEGCGSQADFDGCLDCERDCVSARKDCVDACPE